MFHEVKLFQKFFIRRKSLFFWKCVHIFVYIPVSKHFSLATIINPPDRCGISGSWLYSTIITQVHLMPGTIEGHSKMCSYVAQCQRYQVEGACNWERESERRIPSQFYNWMPSTEMCLPHLTQPLWIRVVGGCHNRHRWLRVCQPELANICILISQPQAASNILWENLAVRPTGLTG
jgi:hypothetical protein